LPHLGDVRTGRSQIRLEVRHQPVRIFFHQRTHGRNDICEQRFHLEVFQVEIDPAGLDLRQIEDIIDQRQQVFPRAIDLVQVLDVFLLVLVLQILGEHLAVADDRVERCTQLVAHVGEECALGAIGGLGVAS